jgi:hypothetical protein
MEVRTFQPQDLHALSLQREQSGLQGVILGEGYGESLAAVGEAFTATSNGEIIACIGTIPQWANYSRAWALLSGNAGRCMVPLTRRIATWLRFHNPGRIDTQVHCDFPQAMRWAEMLGFENEGRMKKYDPSRRDCYLYAQVV